MLACIKQLQPAVKNHTQRVLYERSSVFPRVFFIRKKAFPFSQGFFQSLESKAFQALANRWFARQKKGLAYEARINQVRERRVERAKKRKILFLVYPFLIFMSRPSLFFLCLFNILPFSKDKE